MKGTMKHLIVIALFLNAFLVAGRLLQESRAVAQVPAPSRNGDVNCDGTLDLSDAVVTLRYLFNGGPEPCAFAQDASLEDRVLALEQSLSDLLDSRLAHRADIGALSVADVGLAALRLETDITARLSEIHAVATAGTDVTVDPGAGFGLGGFAVDFITAVEPVALLSPKALHGPRAISVETDAALDALNILVDAVNEAVLHTRDGYAQLLAAASIALSREEPLAVTHLLDAMVAKNLEALRAILTGEEFRAAKEHLDALVAAWEENLFPEGDTARFAMVDLQIMLEKMQQTMERISTVSKMFHETSVAYIRTIR